MRRLACSSGVRLVTSISARSTSPSDDCTLRRPRPRADARGDASRREAARPVSAKRPENFSFLFKASPGMAMRTHRRVRRNGSDSPSSRRFEASTPDPPVDLDPALGSWLRLPQKQQLVKDGNDHNISEIG